MLCPQTNLPAARYAAAVGANVGDLLAAVAASLRPELASLCAAMVEQMAREIPDLAADASIEELLEASVTANVATILDLFAAGADVDQLEAPAAAVEYARRLAQRGVAISGLLRAYRLGQAVFQQRMIRGVAAQSTVTDVVVAAAIELAATTFNYIDRISEQVVVAYQTERDRWLRNRGAVRSARVMSLLAGGEVNIGEAEKSLAYPLRRTHRGVVVWVEANSEALDRLSRLERVVGRIGEHYGCERAPLVIAPDDSTVWAWLPVQSKPAPPGQGAPVIADDTAWVAVGDPAPGVDGFRLTHRQARQAQIVAMAADARQRTRVTESAQAGLVALMCADLDAVRAWVYHALGGLAVADENNARMRETVRVFLSAGGSYTVAAQQLTLHKNTVQYRIRKAEEMRGRPLTDGRLDVEVALLAVHLLGTKVLQPPPSR
jgi:DNA-binding PucR family transcriptional regulator